MKIYNTLTRKKEEFVPIDCNEIKIYACGPTVYNFIHIGNSRPLCVFDVLRRYMASKGMNVKFVQNFTDIDDKIIKRANEENSDYKTVSEKYIAEFKIDAKGLNVMEATVHPRATENIDNIINIIKGLEEKGFAYASNGDVYFRTRRFNGYGKLSKQSIDDLESGARIEVGAAKEDALDFALWKASKEGEPYWDSPWGKGRPGWHIECSAMAGRYLGKTIDIHCGGQDLIFPHHENEIAQSECFNGCNFSNYWMHNGFITVDNTKMSKSLGNFFTVRDVAEKYGYEPIRLLMISAHYRSPINYSYDAIEQCRASLTRLYTCRDALDFALQNSKENENSEFDADVFEFISKHEKAFDDAMDDDLNTADAIAAVFSLTRDVNTCINEATQPSKVACEAMIASFDKLCGILGLVYNRKNNTLDAEIEELIEKRALARKNKDFATADKIRDELKARNIILEDTPQGVKWHIENNN